MGAGESEHGERNGEYQKEIRRGHASIPKNTDASRKDSGAENAAVLPIEPCAHAPEEEGRSKSRHRAPQAHSPFRASESGNGQS